MKREKDDVLGEAAEQDSDGPVVHRDEFWKIPAHNNKSFYFGSLLADDFHAQATDPEVQFQIHRNKLDEAPWSGNFAKQRRKPSTRKPPKRKRIPEDDEKTKGGNRKGAQKQRQRGRGSATDTFPDSSPPPGSASSLDLVNNKPSKRGKPSRVARARARARGKGLYANKDDWKYMEQDEKDAYLQELAKRPPEVAEILLKALPPEAREAGEKRDDESEQYNVYGDADRNDDDAQDEHRDSDIDDDGNDEESEPDADETEDDVWGDDEPSNEPGAQEEDYGFGQNSQDADEGESGDDKGEMEMDESEDYWDIQYSPDDDFDQHIEAIAAEAGDVDAEGAVDADMADVDADASDASDADGDADSGAEYDIDIDFGGMDMDWDMGDWGDWGDFQ